MKKSESLGQQGLKRCLHRSISDLWRVNPDQPNPPLFPTIELHLDGVPIINDIDCSSIYSTDLCSKKIDEQKKNQSFFHLSIGDERKNLLLCDELLHSLFYMLGRYTIFL